METFLRRNSVLRLGRDCLAGANLHYSPEFRRCEWRDTDGGCGAHGFGAIYKMSLQGKVTTLYDFCPTDCADGKYRQAAPVLGNDGNFY
jgi:uncharacterized repeat protein (TIGR03803 family)